MCKPVQIEAVIGMLATTDPDDRQVRARRYAERSLDDGFHSMDRRLKEYGPLEPERFTWKTPTTAWRSARSA